MTDAAGPTSVIVTVNQLALVVGVATSVSRPAAPREPGYAGRCRAPHLRALKISEPQEPT